VTPAAIFERRDYEFYETPQCHIDLLFRVLERRGLMNDLGSQFFEPCVGSQAVVSALRRRLPRAHVYSNDIDPRWRGTYCFDAAAKENWASLPAAIDTTITNPAFSIIVPVLENGLRCSKRAVILYARASFNEVLKTGVRRALLGAHPPTGHVWLPRFAYQRSRTKGVWVGDTVCSLWMIWVKSCQSQFIEYADERCLIEQDDETPAYRDRMDRLNGLTGSEDERADEWRSRWA
jgi:hypothetical protein